MMTTEDERLKVLRMLQNGSISVEESIQLLDALDMNSDDISSDRVELAWSAQPEVSAYSSSASTRGRILQIKVSDTVSGETKINVRLPVGVIKAGLKLGMRFTPDLDSQVENSEVMKKINSGATGEILDLVDEADQERVQVSIE